jgi:type VI secretion system protein ImpM
MQTGLFGKLPARRDFVAAQVGRDFLRAWEAWLQDGLQASQEALGPDWDGAYMNAPIWRFWIGHGVFGRNAAGCLMPSVDGVGRTFPLTLVSIASEGEELAAGRAARLGPWFDAAEQVMLDALEPETTLEATPARLDPLARAIDAALRTNSYDPLADVEDRSNFVHSAGRLGFMDSCPEDSTWWWTIGGETEPARAFVNSGLPSPGAFASLLGSARQDRGCKVE